MLIGKRSVLGIDPGSEQTAWCTLTQLHDDRIMITAAIEPNRDVLRKLKTGFFQLQDLSWSIEMIACYGMPVGREVFETCLWIGRYLEVGSQISVPRMLYRTDIKQHICHSVRANDSNIRTALIDRYGKPGTKKAPGATYGLSKDMWAALAVATTTFDDPQWIRNKEGDKVWN